jgi:hypothetical protein
MECFGVAGLHLSSFYIYAAKLMAPACLPACLAIPMHLLSHEAPI